MANHGLRATLTVSDIRVGDAAPLEFRLTNESSRNLVVLRWHTPLEGVAGKIFRVLDPEGNELRYRGLMAKRGAPTRADYVTVAAGSSVVAQVDLAESYELTDLGAYSVEFISPETSQVLSEGQQLAKSPDDLERIHIPANTVTLHVAESQGATTREPREGDAPSAAGETLLAPPTPKTLSFSNCDAASESAVTETDAAAAFNAGIAHNYLKGLDATKAASDQFYKKWFGQYTASRFSTVLANFDTIASTLESDDISYNCAGPSCQSSWYAYVYPGGAVEVFLCQQFWNAGTSGVDTRWGTVIHEISHEVASTDDHVYGQTSCQTLASNDPDRAIDNADSYEYFVEDIVMSLAEGCNAILSGLNSSGKALAKQARRVLRR